VKIVVEVTKVSVEPPLVDGARAFITRLGVFSKFSGACEWLAKRSEDGPWDGAGILYYVVDTIVLDEQPMRRVATLVQGGDDQGRGFIPGDIEKPWDGRAPEDCKFQLGQLVGFVDGEQYRIGVVLALPPSPEDVKRVGQVTVGDDVYRG
jgi:hypothetical protein